MSGDKYNVAGALPAAADELGQLLPSVELPGTAVESDTGKAMEPAAMPATPTEPWMWAAGSETVEQLRKLFVMIDRCEAGLILKRRESLDFWF